MRNPVLSQAVLKSPCSFFCHDCDSCTVKSDDPKTGIFLTAWGHRVEAGVVSMDYVSVVFALCTQCLDARKNIAEEIERT